MVIQGTIYLKHLTPKIRTEQAKETAAGSGVGLYLSGQIIKLHNGRVFAESEGEGKGSTFFIELPIAEKDEKVAMEENNSIKINKW